MKHLFIATASMLMISHAGASFAQDNAQQDIKKETVIIKEKDGDGQTVVEIRDGKVYLNGEKVADADAYKKIIIDSKRDIEEFTSKWGSLGRPMLGVYTSATKRDNGVMIDRIEAASGAEKAGLQKGDVLTHIDGNAINTPEELVEAVNKHKKGDDILITYLRDNKKKETKATLTASRLLPAIDLPDLDKIPNVFDKPILEDLKMDIFTPTPKLGVTVEERPDKVGVTITDVRPGTAEKAGLQKGDVILSLDNEEITSINGLLHTLRQVDMDKDINVKYMRNGKKHTTNVFFPKPVRSKEL